MKKVLVFIIIFQNFCFLKAQNTDYLEPCSSVFSDFQTESEYFISIHKILFNGLSNFPSARTLICPSFEPEYLISIEREEFESNYQRVFSREFYLKYRTCKPGIRASFFSKRKKTLLITKEIKVDSVFATTLEKLYNKAISQVRFHPVSTNVQGTSVELNNVGYYFMTKTGFVTTACGKTVSPVEGSKMYDLKTISELLKNYAETNDNSIKKEILSKAKELDKRFDTDENTNKPTPVHYERYAWLSLVILLLVSNLVFVIRYKRKKRVHS